MAAVAQPSQRRPPSLQVGRAGASPSALLQPGHRRSERAQGISQPEGRQSSADGQQCCGHARPAAQGELRLPRGFGSFSSCQVCSTHELTNPGVADVILRPDRKLLATAGWDHRVRIFRWSTMKPLAVLNFHRASVHCVAFTTNGLLAAGSGDERISVWDLYPNT